MINKPVTVISRRKRVFDIVLTCLTSIVWVPVMLLCAGAILILEGRPVFYVSDRRVGIGINKWVFKFRTMVKTAERQCNRDTTPVENGICFLNVPIDSPLYTGIGQLIERLTLTEIPQFLMVLRGHLSLIGNRPLPDNVMELLRSHGVEVEDRFLTPAGVTGPAQLVGKEELTDGERLSIEIAYCRLARQSYDFILDFKILLFTVLISLKLKSAMSVDDVHELLNLHSRVALSSYQSS